MKCTGAGNAIVLVVVVGIGRLLDDAVGRVHFEWLFEEGRRASVFVEVDTPERVAVGFAKIARLVMAQRRN
jgi:hypothetical protein